MLDFDVIGREVMTRRALVLSLPAPKSRKMLPTPYGQNSMFRTCGNDGASLTILLDRDGYNAPSGPICNVLDQTLLPAISAMCGCFGIENLPLRFHQLTHPNSRIRPAH